MTSLILETTARLIVPVLLLFSLFLLLHGHDQPGGGFAGGLVAAAAYVLVAIARTPAAARQILAVEPPVVVGGGLALALAAGGIGLLRGQPFLTAAWIDLSISGVELHLGTPLLFDIGVYLVVVGTTIGIVLSLIEEQSDDPAGAER